MVTLSRRVLVRVRVDVDLEDSRVLAWIEERAPRSFVHLVPSCTSFLRSRVVPSSKEARRWSFDCAVV